MWRPLSETNPVYAALSAERNGDGEPADAAGITRAWMDGRVTTEELAREHVRLIAQDVASGQVPWDVYDFSELHDFTDANTYSLDVMGMDATGYGTDLTDTVQDRVAEMLRGSRPGSLTWPPEFRRQRQRLAGEDRDHDLRLYLRSMGRQSTAGEAPLQPEGNSVPAQKAGPRARRERKPGGRTLPPWRRQPPPSRR